MEQPEDSEDGSEDHPLDPNAPSPAVFKCSVCDFTTKYQATLSKHESEQHFKTKFFRCGKCTYVTHIKARYTKHVKYHSMPMIKCDMCDFRTPYKWNLDRHCKNHNGNGTFRLIGPPPNLAYFGISLFHSPFDCGIGSTTNFFPPLRFGCSACNFTADIKQSLTVHEMNHHVPPVGQVASGSVGSGGRRRNKVGASDATAAEEAAAAAAAVVHVALGGGSDGADDELTKNEEGQQQSSTQALVSFSSSIFFASATESVVCTI
nr:unnamed protein product [Callosobruchus chinensis]